MRGSAGATGNQFALVFAGDDAYALGLAVAMRSALENLSPAIRPEIWVLDNDLSASSRRRLVKVVAATGSADDLRWIRIPSERLARVAPDSHLAPATYSRLLIPELLPLQIRRAVYLDADIVVRRDLSPLLTVDLRGAPIAVVKDYLITSTLHELSGVRDRTHLRPYFNAGVLVIDVPRWRAEAVAERALQYAAAGAPLSWADQDALNGLQIKWCELEYRWNVQVRPRDLFVARRPPATQVERRLVSEYGDLRRAAWVLHFAGYIKPWQHRCLTVGTAYWVRALLRTGWYSHGEAMAWLLRRHRARLRYRLGTAKKQGWNFSRT